MKIQTDGFVVIGDLPNDEYYACLICRNIPERIHQDLFVPEPEDIPESFPLPANRGVVVPYRLCPRCYAAKPDSRRIRLLILERLRVVVGDL